MWWPAISRYHVGAMGSRLFNNVLFLSYFQSFPYHVIMMVGL